MPLKVQLHGNLWCVGEDSEKDFSSDYRQVEEWLDQAELSMQYSQSSVRTEPPSTHFGRLPTLMPL